MLSIVRTRTHHDLHADLASAQAQLTKQHTELEELRELQSAVNDLIRESVEDRKNTKHIATTVGDLLTGKQSLDDVQLSLASALLAFDSTGRLLRVLRRCPDCGTRGRTQDVPVSIPGTDDYADTVLCDACGATWGVDPGADGLCDDCGGSGTQGTSPNAALCPCPHEAHGSIAAS